jgi:hypothetical protein
VPASGCCAIGKIVAAPLPAAQVRDPNRGRPALGEWDRRERRWLLV